MNVPTERLFVAFVAGFEASGEGYNGEYVGPRLEKPGVLLRELRRRFDAWVNINTDPDA